MGLATLANIPTTDELLAQFAFANMDSHRRIAAAIFRQMNGMVVPEFPLDPVPLSPDARLVWALNHQAMHNSQNGILGVDGQDFTETDFDSPEQLTYYIQRHFIEHLEAEKQLGIA